MNATDEHQNAIDRLRDELTAFIAAQVRELWREIERIREDLQAVKLQIRRKPLARQDVAALRLPAEATRTHVLDYALAERRNAGRVRHGEHLLE